MMLPSVRLAQLQCWWKSEKLRYLVVGAFNTGLGYAGFVLLFLLLNQRIHYLVIGLLAHAVAVCIAFANHRYLVFRSRAPWLKEFVRFNMSLVAVVLVGLLVLYVLVELCGLDPLLAQAIATPLTVIASYLMHRAFSLRQPRVGDHDTLSNH